MAQTTTCASQSECAVCILHIPVLCAFYLSPPARCEKQIYLVYYKSTFSVTFLSPVKASIQVESSLHPSPPRKSNIAFKTIKLGGGGEKANYNAESGLRRHQTPHSYPANVWLRIRLPLCLHTVNIYACCYKKNDHLAAALQTSSELTSTNICQQCHRKSTLIQFTCSKLLGCLPGRESRVLRSQILGYRDE